MRRKLLLVVFALSFVLAGCGRSVHLTVAAAGDFDGAVIKLDGRPVEHLRCLHPSDLPPIPGADKSFCLVDFRVSIGHHELRIEKTGYEPLVRKLDYDGSSGEDYLTLGKDDLKPLGEPRPGKPENP